MDMHLPPDGIYASDPFSRSSPFLKLLLFSQGCRSFPAELMIPAYTCRVGAVTQGNHNTYIITSDLRVRVSPATALMTDSSSTLRVILKFAVVSPDANDRRHTWVAFSMRLRKSGDGTAESPVILGPFCPSGSLYSATLSKWYLTLIISRK
jgi:hypothetical protein